MQTTIQYQIASPEHVTLEIYNVIGQKVRTLINDRLEAGNYITIWDGRNNQGLPVTTGTYIYRFKAGNYTSVKEMVLLK
jgi:flagellar hook assembly protein FlgD